MAHALSALRDSVTSLTSLGRRGSSHPPGYLLVWEGCMHAGKMMMRSAYRLPVHVIRKGLESDEKRNTEKKTNFPSSTSMTSLMACAITRARLHQDSIVVPASVQRHPCRLLHHFPRHPGTRDPHMLYHH